MANEGSKTDLLTTQLKELTKQYVALDVNDRPEFIYTTGTETADGGECTVVQYVYLNATSAQVIKMKESKGVLVSATMDI